MKLNIKKIFPKKLLSSRKILVILFAVFLLIIATVSVRWYIVDSSEKYLYSSILDLPMKKVGIVLGAYVRPDGRVSDVLADRLLSARDAYQWGKIQAILLSGDNSTTHYNEVEAMKQYLVGRGVREDAIVMDYAGFDTYDTMYRARDIFGVKDAIIFTQDFHLNRSVYIAKSLGLDVVGFRSDRQQYVGMRYQKIREFLSSQKAFWDASIWGSKPKFLGKKEETVISLQ